MVDHVLVAPAEALELSPLEVRALRAVGDESHEAVDAFGDFCLDTDMDERQEALHELHRLGLVSGYLITAAGRAALAALRVST